jgi:hypothetical protein
VQAHGFRNDTSAHRKKVETHRLIDPITNNRFKAPEGEGEMTEAKEITAVAMSIEARDGGKAVVLVRITNPYSDADFYMQVPVDGFDTALADARKKVYEFAKALLEEAGSSSTLTFSK